MRDVESLRSGDPEVVGGYRLLGRLGQGGQGTVYLGASVDGSRVAVKTLNADDAADPRHRDRFVREADAARRVASFCTAAVLAADFAASPPYIVSEFVDGPSLRDVVRRDGPLAGGDLYRVAVATVTALVAIHEAGVVHRDFKPSNVLLGPGGARVIDFGIAQAVESTKTLTDSVAGTPAYMSPEQVRDGGGRVGSAADMFAWAAVMVYASTGQHAFSAETVPAVLHQVVNADADVTGVPEPLHGLVASCLHKEPDRRPGTVDILMSLLGRREQPTDSAGVTRVMEEATALLSDPGREWPPRRRSRTVAWPLGIAVAVLALLVAAGIFAAGRITAGDDETAGAEPQASPTAGAAQGPADPTGSTDETPETSPDTGGPVGFAEGYSGEWTGEGPIVYGPTGPTSQQYSMTISSGSGTATLHIEDSCRIDLSLVEETDRGHGEGYSADTAKTGDCPPGFATADLWLQTPYGPLIIEPYLADGTAEPPLRLDRP